MKVAIVGGTGAEGLGLGLRFAAAGHEVTIGSRSEDRARESAELITRETEPETAVEGAANDAAVVGAGIVVVTVPFAGMVEGYRSIADVLVEGQIVLDCTSPLMTAVGGRPGQVLRPWQGSAAELARRLLPDGVLLVSGLHTVAAGALTSLEVVIDADAFVCGDDQPSKQAVSDLIASIPHMRTIDCGPLEMARILETLTPLMIRLNRRYDTHGAGLAVVGIDHPRPRAI